MFLKKTQILKLKRSIFRSLTCLCLYVSLQPIVSALLWLDTQLCMYWVEEYGLFSRCRKPIPSTDFVNKAVYQIIFLGPLTHIQFNFDPNGIPPKAILLNLVALFLSLFFVILSFYSFIISCCFSQTQNAKITKYEDDRSFFTIEYECLNPTNAKEAIKELASFKEKKKEQMKSRPKQEQQEFKQKQMASLQQAAYSKPKTVVSSNYANYYQPQAYGYGYQPMAAYAPYQASIMPAYSPDGYAQQQSAYGYKMISLHYLIFQYHLSLLEQEEELIQDQT